MPQITFSSPESARVELLTLMLYSDDETARNVARIEEKVTAALASAPSLTLTAPEASALLHAPSLADVQADERERGKQALGAGDILAGIYIVEYYRLSPSINRSIHAYRQHAMTTTYGDGDVGPEKYGSGK